MRSAERTTQGDADGLCGIYCLINAMRDWNLESKVRDADREAFRYLMRSGERLNLLTPDRLHDGFEWHELTEIFNLTAKTLREPFKAVPFVDITKQTNLVLSEEFLPIVFEQKGKAVISIDRGEHWVLATGMQGKKSVAVIDPSRRSTRSSVPIKSIDSNHTGLAILPLSATLKLIF